MKVVLLVVFKVVLVVVFQLVLVVVFKVVLLVASIVDIVVVLQVVLIVVLKVPAVIVLREVSVVIVEIFVVVAVVVFIFYFIIVISCVLLYINFSKVSKEYCHRISRQRCFHSPSFYQISSTDVTLLAFDLCMALNVCTICIILTKSCQIILSISQITKNRKIPKG